MLTYTVWMFLLVGYVATILVELPIVYVGLSALPRSQRIFLGIWLTACTYPFVVLVFPTLFRSFPDWVSLSVAEVFAPSAECFLLWLSLRRKVVWPKAAWVKAMLVVVLANLASFGVGAFLNHSNWFGLWRNPARICGDLL